MTRTSLRLPWQALIDACARADIVIADRMMPRGCAPRWIKLDRPALNAMGGALILLEDRKIIGGRDPRDRHPWIVTPADRWRSAPRPTMPTSSQGGRR